jgi:hypothetical protein
LLLSPSLSLLSSILITPWSIRLSPFFELDSNYSCPGLYPFFLQTQVRLLFGPSFFCLRARLELLLLCFSPSSPWAQLLLGPSLFLLSLRLTWTIVALVFLLLLSSSLSFLDPSLFLFSSSSSSMLP